MGRVRVRYRNTVGAQRSQLVAPLQWIAIGLVLFGVVTVRVGRLSSSALGLVVLAWAAHTGRTACANRDSRAWWSVVMVTAAVAAAVSSAPVDSVAWDAVVAIVSLGAVALLVPALAGTTEEFGLSTAGRWRSLTWAVGPAYSCAVMVGLVTANVGTPPGPDHMGFTASLGSRDLVMPTWAWWVVLFGMVPGVTVLVLSLLAFVRTYREAKAPDEVATPPSAPDGASTGG